VASGGRVLYVSDIDHAPFFIGVEVNEERLGLLCYVFRCNPPPIKGRNPDEHRVQVRYGGQASWEGDHSLGQDVAGVDVTMVLGVHPDADILIGLDPLTYDPLPLGISIEFKQDDVDRVQQAGWHVWERPNFAGRRRGVARAVEQLETIVGFTPSRLLDYARLERQATALGLDPPLRYAAAKAATSVESVQQGARHLLEREFDLDHVTLLNIIEDRGRLKVAVRGGVAEHHLGEHLRADPAVKSVRQVDQDGPPDFEVELWDGRLLGVECKNASPDVYKKAEGSPDAPGDPKVEAQKTRAQKGDPAGRLYRPEQFDVLAVCLFAVSHRWEFRFRLSSSLVRDDAHPSRIRAMQRVNSSWSDTVSEAT
jgi:hypothetical protein